MNHGGETVVTKALTDRVEQAEGRGKGRGITNHITILTKDADSFKGSKSQVAGKIAHNK